jgi:anti-anti-sigma regulatory factor
MIDIKTRPDTTLECSRSVTLDWRSSMTPRHAVDEAMCPGQMIIIDPGHVVYIDAVGLSAMMGIARRALALGASVELRNARPPVRRRIDLVTGSDPNRITADIPADAAFSGRQVHRDCDRATSRSGGINIKEALLLEAGDPCCT